jgi:hypothetical protein
MKQPFRRNSWTVILALLGLLTTLARIPSPEISAAPPDPRWLDFGIPSRPAPPELVLLASDPTAIDLAADLPGCMAETQPAEGWLYTRLHGEGYGSGTKTGMPDLPVLRRDVEVPFGAQVTLELVEAEYAVYTLEELGLHPIYPLQPPVPKVEGAWDRRRFEIDETFYAHGAHTPAEPVRLGEEYVVRGHRVQPVEVWPVAYDPQAGTVRLYSGVRFRLRLEGSDVARTQALAERYASPTFETRLARRILNYNQGRPPAAFGQQTEMGYLIITADAYYDAMLPFATLRDRRGFDVTMTRLSEIPGSGTNSDIKDYIQTAYDTWAVPPSYVLLVGDTDTIPGWISSPPYGRITDLYYVTMDGSDDWHPDMGRGRFPVRSAAQTTAMVDKYLAYADLRGQESWVSAASFIASCDSDFYNVAEATHNYVIDTYTGPLGYWGIFPNTPQTGGDRLYCITHGADGTDIQASLDQGRWIAIYSGHGGYTEWEMGYGQDDVRNLTSHGIFPFVASHACITGDFLQEQVFGETWVLQEDVGALVFWGSSDSSTWNEDDVLERVTFDSLFSDPRGHADVTEMTYDGLAAVEASYPSTARYYWETYNVLGDPAVKIFLEPDPPTFNLTVEPDRHGICASGSVSSSVRIDSVLGYSETVHLQAGPLPSGVTPTLIPPSAQAPYTSRLTLDVAPGTAAGDHTLFVTATDQMSYTFEVPLSLRVVGDVPAGPNLTSPVDGAVDQLFLPQLEWDPLPYATIYHLQLDYSPLFDNPLIDVQDVAATTYIPASPLEERRCYWWRVQGENVCGVGNWADPFHFATLSPELVFFDDMESGDGQWSHQAAQGSDHWQLTTGQSHSPTHAWYVLNDNVVTDSWLRSVSPITVGNGSTLTFWHRHQFEYSYDGGVLEISTDGSTWSDLGPYITANGYNGTLSTCCSNPLGGREAWVDDLTDWTQVEVDLTAFAGQSIYLRWRIGCDHSISEEGWYIDDVAISAPRPANPAPSLLEIQPNVGAAAGATTVHITGTHFITSPHLRLGDTWLRPVARIGSNRLQGVVPAGMTPGTYDLTLYNGDCQIATLSEAFTVTEGCVQPNVSLLAGSPVPLGSVMHFTASLISGTPPLTYTWDFGGAGDGIGLDTPTPAYTYTLSGNFTATVTVENPCGIDIVSEEVTVYSVGHSIYLPLVLRE